MTAAYYISSPTPFNSRNRLLTDSLVLRFTSIVIFRTAHMMACSVVACHLTALLRHPCAQLFLPRSPRRPLSTTFCGQKQQASISLSFSLSRRFPHLGIASPYRAKLRLGFLYIRKSPDAFTPRFLTDLRRNSLTFYFQNHQYQFRKCIY